MFCSVNPTPALIVANGNPGFGYLDAHARATGCASESIMTLEDAIKKMTFLPASVFGIHDRGLLRRGMAADMFVFDPDDHRSSQTGSGQRPPRRRAALHPGRQRNPLHHRQRLGADEKRRAHRRVSGESAAECLAKEFELKKNRGIAKIFADTLHICRPQLRDC